MGQQGLGKQTYFPGILKSFQNIFLIGKKLYSHISLKEMGKIKIAVLEFLKNLVLCMR